jgi:hypothetical protein
METTTISDSEREQLEFYRNFYERYQRVLAHSQDVAQRLIKDREESERWNEYDPFVSCETLGWFYDLFLSHFQRF